MLIVLVLTSVVVGIAYSVLILTSKHINKIESRFEESNELRMLKLRLTRDFDKAKSIIWSDKNYSLLLVNENQSNAYLFTNKYVLINTDTTYLPTYTIDAFESGIKKNSGEIDAISISVDFQNINHEIFISTQKSSVDLTIWE